MFAGALAVGQIPSDSILNHTWRCWCCRRYFCSNLLFCGTKICSCFFSRNPLARGSAEARCQSSFSPISARNVIQCAQSQHTSDGTAKQKNICIHSCRDNFYSLFVKNYVSVWFNEFAPRSAHRSRHQSVEMIRKRHKEETPKEAATIFHFSRQELVEVKGATRETNFDDKKFAINFHLFSAVCFTQTLLCRRCVLRANFRRA